MRCGPSVGGGAARLELSAVFLVKQPGPPFATKRVLSLQPRTWRSAAATRRSAAATIASTLWPSSAQAADGVPGVRTELRPIDDTERGRS